MSNILGSCDEVLKVIKFFNIEDAASWVGERTFSCDCSAEFGLEFDESCTTKWTYFCNPKFIAHYGYKVTLNSNWVQSFNKSIATDIYGHSVAEYPELPLVCEMSYRDAVKTKGFLISTDPAKLYDEHTESYAMSLAQIWLSLFVMAFVVMFFVRQCTRTGKLIYRRCTQKYEENGKDIDIFLVGSVKDTKIMNQLASDLTKCDYNVMKTTDNLLPGKFSNDKSLQPQFARNATRIKVLVHLFSPGILTKVSDRARHDKAEDKSNDEDMTEHTWFTQWFAMGMRHIRETCDTNQIKKICITVFREFEGGKPVPNELEKMIKDKIEAELKEVNAKTLHVPIVEFSKSFQQCLPEKKIYIGTENGKELVHTLGPFEADAEYRKSFDKLLLHLPLSKPKSKSKKSKQEQPADEVPLTEVDSGEQLLPQNDNLV